MTATAGFLLAADGNTDFYLLLATLVGVSLIIASGCVINNYIDRNLDKLMARTKKRAFVTRVVSVRNGLVYGAALGIVGFSVLVIYVNVLTALLGFIGIFFYVVMYSIWKRSSVHGTVVGSVSGAMPVVAGYTAVTNQLDRGAVLLFLILTFWQMPHFYAIAVFRLNDYKAARLPVLPVVSGIRATKVQMLVYIVAFTIASGSLTVFGYTGLVYLLTMLAFGFAWLRLAVNGFGAKNNAAWARQLFSFSLVVLTGFSALLALNSLLP